MTKPNKRLLNLTARAVLLSLLGLSCATTAVAATVSGDLKKWHPVNIDFDGPSANENSSPNPFLDYRLNVILTRPNGSRITVPGYFAGDGKGGGSGSVWRVRFAPDASGNWDYSASFRQGNNVAISLNANAGSTTGFNGESGSFSVGGRDSQAPGFLALGALEYVGKHYLKHRDGPYWIKTGTDSPENLLAYAGFDDTVDTGGIGDDFVHRYAAHRGAWRDGDAFFSSNKTGTDSLGIIGALNYLSDQGVNSVYFLPMNLGGDGQDTWPFIGANKSSAHKTRYDISKLHQWAQVFDHAQRRGIALNVVLSETEQGNERWLDNGNLGVERKLFFRELVARFGFVLGLKWNLGEEADFFKTAQLREHASYLRELDWVPRLLTVHTRTNQLAVYDPLYGNKDFNASSIQYAPSNAGKFVEQTRNKSRQAGNPWIVDMDENHGGLTDKNATDLRRQVLYDVLFSGGNVEWYAGYHPNSIGGDLTMEDFSSRQSMWRFSRFARELVESTPFWDMEPADSLLSGEGSAHGGGEVFAKKGDTYLVYLPAMPAGTLDLRQDNVAFTQRWFNPATGQYSGSARAVNGGQRLALGSAPGGNVDWVVELRANDATMPPTPVDDEPETPTEETPTEETPVEPSQEEEPAPDPVVEEDVQEEPEEEVVAEVVVQQPEGDSPVSESPVNLPPEIAPIDDVEVVAGTRIELNLVPSDPEGVVPSIYLESAPKGVEFPDNGAGGRTLMWQTDTADVGEHTVQVTAVDALDNTLTDTLSFKLIVQPHPVLDAEPTQEPVAEPTPEPVAEPTPEPVAEPVQEPTPVEANDAPVAAAQNLAPSIAPLPDQVIYVGQRLRVLVLPIDPEGIVPALNAEGLPTSASFADNLNGTRTVLWQPAESDIGQYEVTFQATDSRDAALQGSATLRISVLAANSSGVPEEAYVFSGNQSPFFRSLAAQQVKAGELLEFDVVPIDPEGIAPILHVRNAPEQVTFSDNGNGTRKLVWQTGAADIGVYQLQFVAIDQEDSALSVTQIVDVTVTP